MSHHPPQAGNWLLTGVCLNLLCIQINRVLFVARKKTIRPKPQFRVVGDIGSCILSLHLQALVSVPEEVPFANDRLLIGIILFPKETQDTLLCARRVKAAALCIRCLVQDDLEQLSATTCILNGVCVESGH